MKIQRYVLPARSADYSTAVRLSQRPDNLHQIVLTYDDGTRDVMHYQDKRLKEAGFTEEEILEALKNTTIER